MWQDDVGDKGDGDGGWGGRRVDGIGESDSNDKVNSWRGEERLPMRDGQRDVRKWKESYSRPMDARKLRWAIYSEADLKVARQTSIAYLDHIW